MPSYSEEQLQRIFEKTDGRCHICWEPLDFDGYGDKWEVDHSKPRAKGGSNRLNNLKPAHISCNRRKQARSSRSARRRHGSPLRAPLSHAEKKEIRKGRMVGKGIIGSVLGFLVGGPPGAALGGLLGIASVKDPNEERLEEVKTKKKTKLGGE